MALHPGIHSLSSIQAWLMSEFGLFKKNVNFRLLMLQTKIFISEKAALCVPEIYITENG